MKKKKKWFFIKKGGLKEIWENPWWAFALCGGCLAIFLAMGFLLWGLWGLLDLEEKKHLKIVCPKSHCLIFKRDWYNLCFNKKTKQPNWIFQLIGEDAFDHIQNENSRDYYYDIEIPKEDQISEEDYKDSKYVMSTFLFLSSSKSNETQKEKSEELVFSVTSPQNPAFHNGYWKKIRNRVREVRRLKGVDRVFVISGPLFLSEEEGC